MDYSSQKKIGMRIREIRKRSKLTQGELGKLVNRSNSHIAYIEKGYVRKCGSLIVQIAKVLHVDLEDVLMGEKLPSPLLRTAPPQTPRISFGLRMKPSLVEKLEILAEKRGLTRNGLIEQAIEDFLATHFDEEQEDEN